MLACGEMKKAPNPEDETSDGALEAAHSGGWQLH